MNTLIAGLETRRITPAELALVEPPEATPTHQPVRHADIALEIETALAMRSISVTRQEFAVSADGMRMFGLMVTDRQFDGCNYAVGLRNSNDKSMKLALVAGYRVMVCENMAFAGDFHPLVAKHTSRFSLQDAVALGVDRIHRNLDGVSQQVQRFREHEVSTRLAEEVIYRAFVHERGPRLPKSIMDSVHRNWHEPEHEEFHPKTAWSLANAFTSAFKELKPLRQFQETGKLTPFLAEATYMN